MTEDGSRLQQEVGDTPTVEVVQPGTSEHDTLKYHLLGPSLTKAGQDLVDQQKVATVTRPRTYSEILRFGAGLRDNLQCIKRLQILQ